jgi:hypothetical protein
VLVRDRGGARTGRRMILSRGGHGIDLRAAPPRAASGLGPSPIERDRTLARARSGDLARREVAEHGSAPGSRAVALVDRDRSVGPAAEREARRAASELPP